MQALINDCNEAFRLTEEKASKEHDKDKREMYNKLLLKVRASIEKAKQAQSNGAGEKEEELKKELLDDSSEMLMTWLDKLHGKEVTDNSIFASLPRHFEGEFHKDMAALNVIQPLFSSILFLFNHLNLLIDFATECLDSCE